MREVDHAALSALLERARVAEPPELTPLEARRLVRIAVDSAEQRTRTRTRLLLAGFACAALALLAVLGARFGAHGTQIEVAVGGRALRVALASGDSVVAAPGTQLEVLAEAAHRELRLLAGNALFDVKRLGPQQRFEVHTEQADISVLGTVFSVEVKAGRTVVRVYEGKVQVGGRTLEVGQSWSSTQPGLDADPLAAEGLAAAALRTEPVPRVVVSPLPDVSTRAAADDDAVEVVIKPAPAVATELTLAEVRGWLLAGDSERALLAVLSSPHHEEPAWLMLEADAQRALRRNAEAVDTYQHVAERAPGLRVSAGYTAATLAFYELHDPARTLSMLDSLQLDDTASPLRERASVLRVDVLLALGRREDAVAAARRYLEREPETRVSQRMRAMISEAP